MILLLHMPKYIEANIEPHAHIKAPLSILYISFIKLKRQSLSPSTRDPYDMYISSNRSWYIHYPLISLHWEHSSFAIQERGFYLDDRKLNKNGTSWSPKTAAKYGILSTTRSQTLLHLHISLLWSLIQSRVPCLGISLIPFVNLPPYSIPLLTRHYATKQIT